MQGFIPEPIMLQFANVGCAAPGYQEKWAGIGWVWDCGPFACLILFKKMHLLTLTLGSMQKNICFQILIIL